MNEIVRTKLKDYEKLHKPEFLGITTHLNKAYSEALMR